MKNKAVEFDKRNVARTYLILDSEAYRQGQLIILAYFTLANKSLLLGDTLSNRTKKDIDGFSKEADSVGSVIIGQLGKDEHRGKDIHGDEIIDAILLLVSQVVDIIGGRVMFLECQNEEKLVAFYKRNEFTYLQTNKKSGLLQMVRHL